jgi:hypothetical protein
VGRVRPVLVLLRGFSQVDDASRTLVRALLDAAGPAGEPTPGAPAALLVTGVRTELLGDLVDHPRAANLALEGLDVDGVRKIVSDEAFVARLHAATNGSPEAILGMIERPPPPRATEVASRVGQLGEVSLKVLAALGASGRPLPVHILALAAGVDARRPRAPCRRSSTRGWSGATWTRARATW